MLLTLGCAREPLLLSLRVDPVARVASIASGAPSAPADAIRSIAAVMTSELGLPLPRTVTVLVYPTRAAYAEGLATVGGMPAERAAEIAAYSAGLGQAERLFLSAESLRGAPRRVWLGIVAHELTHVAQYELSGGRRGRSEQWLREGMADWVACRVLERLGVSRFEDERDRAIHAVAQDLATLDSSPLDLLELGRPLGWEARHLRSGDGVTYQLAMLLTDALIRRHGFEAVLAYFRTFADSHDRLGNFQRAFGLSLDEFERDGLRQVRQELRTDAPSNPGEEAVVRESHR